ncbi:hypothetical protein TPENAI_61084 [Tenacibaculum litopenaei]|uniref:gliding motility-associated C-terminal domain-containing protein n=1 Tax=Tenacibaculum litopenaei TaxID=396016 RepID=UPI00389606A1
MKSRLTVLLVVHFLSCKGVQARCFQEFKSVLLSEIPPSITATSVKPPGSKTLNLSLTIVSEKLSTSESLGVTNYLIKLKNNGTQRISGLQIIERDTVDSTVHYVGNPKAVNAGQELIVERVYYWKADQDNAKGVSLTVDVYTKGTRLLTKTIPIALTGKTVKVNNLFSPNGDGINDVLLIQGLTDYTESYLSIYDRSGILVFSAKNYDNTWDGTVNNGRNALECGTYFYTLQLGATQEPLKGWIQIKR